MEAYSIKVESENNKPLKFTPVLAGLSRMAFPPRSKGAA